MSAVTRTRNWRYGMLEPTALVALTVEDVEYLRDKLNKRLDPTGEQWTALAARSMQAEAPWSRDITEH